MNPENYGSREACEMLFKAGIVIETEFSWKRERKGEFIIVFTKWAAYETTPAPSMAEVWRELRKYVPPYGYYRMGVEINGETFFEIAFVEESTFKNTNPTDALIDLLIWVRKEAP